MAQPSLPQVPEWPSISRLERFATIDSTQRVVREWMQAGDPGVCVAVADEQTSGRGRQGRSWVAPHGAALLVSVGVRPRDLALRHAWRLGATVALAMVDAAEEVARLPRGRLWLKWPNDIVADGADGRLLKLAGVLGETATDGDRVSSAIIGIGVNADWRAADFPVHLAAEMTSLRAVSGDRPIDRDALLDAWLDRLGAGLLALEAGTFDAGLWSALQRTTGHEVEVDLGDRRVRGVASGVDPESGGLLVETDGAKLTIDSGEVVRCRIHGTRRES